MAQLFMVQSPSTSNRAVYGKSCIPLPSYVSLIFRRSSICPQYRYCNAMQGRRAPILWAASKSDTGSGAQAEEADKRLNSPEVDEEEEEEYDDDDFKRLIFSNGLTFMIVFVSAFMVPSFLPKSMQDTLGLPGITVIALTSAALITAALAPKTASEKGNEPQ